MNIATPAVFLVYLQDLARGLQIKQVAAKRGKAFETVRKSLQFARQDHGCSTNMQLLVKMVREGRIKMEEI